jgi:hypothetical protein
MKVQVRISQTIRGEYRAWCPPLPGCQVRCQSLPEAQEKLIEAASGYLASMDVATGDVEFETLVCDSVQAH